MKKRIFFDSFGKLPEETVSLFRHLEIKLMLISPGFEKIIISGDTIELFFDLNNESIFTRGFFEKVLGHINESFKNTARVKQGKKTLSILFRLSGISDFDGKFIEIINFVSKLSDI